MNHRQLAITKRLEMAKPHPFNSRCYICRRDINDGKNFTFHHLEYQKDQKKHTDFKTMSAYYDYLEKDIKKNPAQFLLLCGPCHWNLEKMKRYYHDPKRFTRFTKAVRATVT